MLNLGLDVHRITKLKYQSGAFIERHKHDFYHYIYVIWGSGAIEIDQKVYETSTGNLYLIPKNTMHGIYCDKDLTTIDIKFTCSQSSTETLNNLTHCINDLCLHDDNIIRGILSEAITGEPFFEEMINVRFTELMIRILKKKASVNVNSHSFSFEELSVRDEHTKHDLGRILDYIEEHIEEPICINDLAHLLGYSESYFCTIFKKVYGISPNKYINQAKINKAKDLMISSKLNITEIAEVLGYEHIHYFSRLFKKITTASPQHYIKKLNEDIVVNVNRESVFIPTTKYEHPQRFALAK